MLTTTPKIPDSVSTAVTLNDSSSSNSKTVEEFECQKMLKHVGKEIRHSFVRLRQHRRHLRKIPTSLTSIDALQRYTLCERSLHKTNMPGILSLDVDNSKDIIATGGADANVVVSDQLYGNVISTLEGHSKKVTSLKFVKNGELVVTGSADSTVRVWQWSGDGSYKCKHTLDHHTAEVQAVTIHPDQKYFVSASLDGTWKLYDLSCDSRIIQVGHVWGRERFMTAAFHPDGHIIGTGTSGFVRFWDVAEQDDILKLNAHDGPVTSMAFSENGRYLATAAEDGVKLWDLRFLRKLMSFPSDGCINMGPVDFDHSGLYLASGGSHISAYNVASASECDMITSFPISGIGKTSCLKFGKDAKYVAAGLVDSSKLLLFTSPKEDMEY